MRAFTENDFLGRGHYETVSPFPSGSTSYREQTEHIFMVQHIESLWRKSKSPENERINGLLVLPMDA